MLVNQYSGKVLGSKGVDTHIFWGNPQGYYSTASMTSLPGIGTYDTTAADLNDDGFVDLVFSNAGADVSYIYWGSKDGFSVVNRSTLPIGMALARGAADLNHDGYLDLVFTQAFNVGSTAAKSIGTILWGSSEGYSEKKKTVLNLKSKSSLSNVIADLNQDGFLDLIFPDQYFGVMQIYWGSPDGYSESRSWSKFVSAGSLELADLNNDGYLDFIVAGGFDPQKKSYDSRTRIFWGTVSGIPSFDRVVEDI